MYVKGGTASVSPASRLADKVQNLPSAQRPNTVAVIQTADGRYIVGRNSGGVINSEVQSALNEIGVNAFQGNCAEVNALSRAINKGVDLEGASISVSNVRGPLSTSGVHGTPKPPCSTCEPLINFFNLQLK